MLSRSSELHQVCSDNGRSNQEMRHACSVDSAETTPQERECTQCGEPMRAGMVRCRKCGHLVADAALDDGQQQQCLRVNSQCKTQQEEASSAGTGQSSPQERSCGLEGMPAAHSKPVGNGQSRHSARKLSRSGVAGSNSRPLKPVGLCLLVVLVVVGSLMGLKVLIVGSGSPDERAAMCVLEHGGVVKVCVGGGEPVPVVASEDLPEGDYSVTEINVSRQEEFDDLDAKQLVGLDQLERLDLSGTAVTDVGIKYIKKSPRLASLALRGTKITNDGLQELAETCSLIALSVTWCRNISDDGLKGIAELPNLRTLLCASTPIGDACTEHLSRSKSLRRISLVKTKVTKAGIDKLREALPNCRFDEG